MKKIFLPLGLLALIAAPSAGSAKLVLDMPPILAGTSNSCLGYAGCPSGPCYPGCPDPCVKCDLKCVDYSECLAGPCFPGCPDPCVECCSSTCDPCNSSSCGNPCSSNVCVRFNDTGITTPTGGGQDADFGRDKTHNDNADGLAGFSFTKIINGGNTCIKDNVTGLTWSPDLGTSNWDGTSAVVTANSNLCGKPGWRLPTLRELLSIVSYHRTAPAIDNDATRGFFSDTQNASYWTSDPVFLGATQWGINFSTGGTASLDKSTLTFTTKVRLVTSN